MSVHQNRSLVCAIAFTFLPLAGRCGAVHWPNLPKECFVSARPATVADEKKGCAAFLIGQAEESAGVPLAVEIPQYAWLVDQKTGTKTPVILIQAEENSGIKAVGYKALDSSMGVALLSEMVLLGSKKPGE